MKGIVMEEVKTDTINPNDHDNQIYTTNPI